MDYSIILINGKIFGNYDRGIPFFYLGKITTYLKSCF
jgi:hypothetical protein